MSPLALENAPFSPLVLLLLPVLVPSAHLLLALSQAVPRLPLQPPTIQVHLLSAGTIRIMLITPRNVVHRVPGQETSWAAGGAFPYLPVL